MRGFNERTTGPAGEALSIKIRVVSGCFHREHSPQAYRAIDSKLHRLPSDVEFVEHESGPEVLVYVAAATAGFTLAKSIIELITTILKARSEGVKKGDRPADPLELIVRRVHTRHGFKEEIVLRAGHTDKLDLKAVESHLEEALHRLFKG